MRELQVSKHAKTRCQQRGLPPLVLNWLTQFGATQYDHRGAEIRYFDKRSRQELAQFAGKEVVNRLSSLLDAYVVISSDGVVITAGHRYKPITRH